MTSTPPPGQYPGQVPGAVPPSPVEWQVIEHVPGDPWSAELVIWSGEAIDGIAVPLDEELLGVMAEVRHRRDDVDATFDGDHGASLRQAQGPDERALGAYEDEESGSRIGRWWQGLGRTTGSAQADRWLENVPVRWQLIGAGVLLLVFVLVMVIGRLL
ncbi:hypothetical protein HJ590_15900 [Naumannella sp. ID2617S]|nr:hypothetical protein [Naumannella sp. ID2617S]